MTRQERIAYMLSELGEGWEDAERFCPVVRNGMVAVVGLGSGGYVAMFDEPATWGIAPRTRADSPREAVNALLAEAHRRHEEIGEILAAADAAKGWEP